MEYEYLGRSTRRILAASFTILLALLVIAGFAAVRTLADIHTQEQAARLDFLSRTEPMMQMRTKLTLYGELPQTSEQASQIYSQIQSALAQYPRDRAPEEQLLLGRLAAMLADQQHVHPDFKTLAAVEEITVWNDARFRNVNAQLLTNFHQLQTRLKTLLFCLLGSGLAIALGSVVLIAAQEKEIRKRYTELSRLSTRLLDVQEEERRSISRELHDEVGQSLGALLVDMGRLSSILPSGDTQAQDAVQNMRQLTESSVSAVRNIALLLRPSMLDDLGLVAAVEWQAREISRRSDVEVEVDAKDIPDLPEAIKTCVYRLTQEALNNIVRHSGAHRAWVSIHLQDRSIQTRIRDDGKGFDPQRSRGLGILGMEERVRLLHGSLAVNATPGAGAEIIAVLPLT